MTEFEVDGVEYRIGKLTAFQQLHVSRRIAPLVPPLIPVFMSMAKERQSGADVLQSPQLLQPFADGLALLSDETAEYVLNTCLAALKRKQGDNWVAIWNAGAKMAMFEDLNDMGKLIPLAMRVIQDSLGPFIAGLFTSQQTAADAAQP